MMKKLCLAIIAIGMVGAVNAQKVKLGAKAGLNLTTWKGNVSGEAIESKAGLVVGATAELSLSDRFAFQPELLFSQNGTNISLEDEKIKAKLDYISIPVMAKYYLLDNLSVEVGPQVSFLVKESYKVDGTDIEVGGFKEVDFGANFGLGYHFDNGISLQGRYMMGISDIVEESDVQNKGFQFSLGYQF